MSASEEREFDKLLSEHLAGELNPQLGRAGRAFDAMIRHRPSPHQRFFALASGVSLLAASVAIAIWMWPRSLPSHPPTVHPPMVVEKTTPADLLTPRDVDQLVAWHTIDEGVQNIRVDDKPLPVHRLRQEAIQQVEWFDPSDQSTVRVMVPRQQVLLIAQETY